MGNPIALQGGAKILFYIRLLCALFLIAILSINVDASSQESHITRPAKSATLTGTLGWQWALHAGGVHFDVAYALAVDKQGNSYVTGEYQGPADFGGVTLNGGGKDIFVAKYNNAGILQWAQTTFAAKENGSFGICIDSTGNVYVTGCMLDTCDFGNGNVLYSPLPGHGSIDIIVAKYNNDGIIQWARIAGARIDPPNSGNGSEGWGISSDPSGNVYVTGWIAKEADFGDGNDITGRGNNDVFLAKYSADGITEWVRTGGGGVDFDEGLGVSADNFGNVYMTGGGAHSLYFDNGLQFTCHGNNGENDMFVVKYSDEGVIQWLRSAGGVGEDNGRGICTDQKGDVYVTGYYHDTADFSGKDTLYGNDQNESIFVVKYDSNGTVLWTRDAGGQDGDEGAKVCVDDSGNVFVSGFDKSNAVNFGDGDTIIGIAIGSAAAFVAKYNPVGNMRWVQFLIGQNSSEFGDGIGVDTAGDVYTDGYFDQNIVLSCSRITTYGSTDVFVAKIGPVLPTMSAPTTLSYPPLSCNALPDTEQITITNPCGVPLTLDSATITGHDSLLFSISPPFSPTTILSGSSITLTVIFTPSGAGSRSANLLLFNNSAQTPWQVTLSATVNGTQAATMAAPTILSFPTLSCSASPDTEIITIKNPIPCSAPLTISNASFAGANAASFTIIPPFQPIIVPSGDSAKISVVFSSTVPSAYSANLLLDNNTSQNPYTIALSGNVTRAPVMSAPVSLAYPAILCSDPPDTQAFIIKNTNQCNLPLTISNATITGPNAAEFFITPPFSSVTIPAGDSIQIKVVFSSSIVGSHNATLLLDNNSAQTPWTLTLSATVSSSPQPIMSAPTTLSYPALSCGAAPDTQVVTITNSCGAALTIDSAVITGPDASHFALSPSFSSVTIPPGASMQVTVVFLPNAPGTFNATLALGNNSAQDPWNVALSAIVNPSQQVSTLSLTIPPGATPQGTDRFVNVVADDPSLIPNGSTLTFMIINEPTALAFASITSASASATASISLFGDTAFITLANITNAANPLATVYYHTGVGVTLNPTVTLSQVAANIPCITANSTDTGVIALSPCGCHLTTLQVHGFASFLGTAYPNPTDGTATFSYATIENTSVHIALYDPLGEHVATIVDGTLQPGVYDASFDTHVLPSGLYYLTMQAGQSRETRLLSVIK